jgi:hypothetical protein
MQHGRVASAMTDAVDIYRAAKLVIDRHGEDASLYAAARTAVFAGEGDVEGAAVWRQITTAVEELQRERRPDEAVN